LLSQELLKKIKNCVKNSCPKGSKTNFKLKIKEPSKKSKNHVKNIGSCPKGSKTNF